MRKLDMTQDAAKFLQGLDAKQYRQVASKMLSLMADVTPNDYSQLTGYSYYRVDSGEYRMMYRFDNDTVHTVLIGKRSGDEAYEKLTRKQQQKIKQMFGEQKWLRSRLNDVSRCLAPMLWPGGSPYRPQGDPRRSGPGGRRSARCISA